MTTFHFSLNKRVLIRQQLNKEGAQFDPWCGFCLPFCTLKQISNFNIRTLLYSLPLRVSILSVVTLLCVIHIQSVLNINFKN